MERTSMRRVALAGALVVAGAIASASFGAASAQTVEIDGLAAPPL